MNVHLRSEGVRGLGPHACPDIRTPVVNSKWLPNFARQHGKIVEGGFARPREGAGSATIGRLRFYDQACMPSEFRLASLLHSARSRAQVFQPLSRFPVANIIISKNRPFSSSSCNPEVPTARVFAKHLAHLDSPALIEGLQAYDRGQMQQSYRGFRQLREALDAEGPSGRPCAKALVLGCMYTALFHAGEYKEARRFSAEAWDLSRHFPEKMSADAATVCDIQAVLEEAKTEPGSFGVASSLLQEGWGGPSADASLERPSQLVDLRILQTSLAAYKRGAGIAGIGKSWQRRENGETETAVGLPASFFGLMKEYNAFILEYFASRPEETSSAPGGDPGGVLLAAEQLTNQASSLLQHNEAFFRDITPFAEPSPSMGSQAGGVGDIVERITKREIAAELVRGIALLHEGVGTVLIKEENNVATHCDTTAQKLHILGDKVLKDGLTHCKKYAYLSTKNLLAQLLSALATSFKQQQEPVLSEGLFRSSLNEFNTSKGLNVQLASVRDTAGDKDHLGGEPHVAYPRQARLDTIVSFGVTLLEYSALLRKWDGREYEAEMFSRAANQILGLCQRTTPNGSLWNIPDRLHLLPLLWKPSVYLARPLLVYVKEREAVSGNRT